MPRKTAPGKTAAKTAARTTGKTAAKTPAKTASAKKTTSRPPAVKAAATRRPSRPAPTRLSAVRDAQTPAAPGPLAHEEIQLKAFDLWQSRGGDHLTNWFEAETILKRERRLAVSN